MAPYRTTPCPKTHRGPTDEQACCVCNRPIAKHGKRLLIHLIHGGGTVLHPDDEDLYEEDNADLGFSPIGKECARKLGMEWTVRLEEETP